MLAFWFVSCVGFALQSSIFPMQIRTHPHGAMYSKRNY